MTPLGQMWPVVLWIKFYWNITDQLFPSILSDDNHIAWEVSGIMGVTFGGDCERCSNVSEDVTDKRSVRI